MYSNNYSRLTHAQRYPGLGDIERTAPTAREDFKNNRVAAKKAHDDAKNAALVTPHTEYPRSSVTGKRHDPTKPISLENPAPAYKDTPGVDTPPLSMDSPNPHNVGAQFGGAGTPNTNIDTGQMNTAKPYNPNGYTNGGMYY
jgi:hypothetical protein